MFSNIRPHYKARRQSELEDKSHDVSEKNDVDDSCDLAEKFRKPAGYDYVFYSAFQFSSCWRDSVFDGEDGG